MQSVQHPTTTCATTGAIHTAPYLDYIGTPAGTSKQALLYLLHSTHTLTHTLTPSLCLPRTHTHIDTPCTPCTHHALCNATAIRTYLTFLPTPVPRLTTFFLSAPAVDILGQPENTQSRTLTTRLALSQLTVLLHYPGITQAFLTYCMNQSSVETSITIPSRPVHSCPSPRRSVGVHVCFNRSPLHSLLDMQHQHQLD